MHFFESAQSYHSPTKNKFILLSLCEEVSPTASMTSTFDSQDKARNMQSLDEIEEKTISQLTADILDQCSLMEKECQKTQTVLPSLAAGTRTDFWSPSSLELTTARSKALFLLERLSILLQGPHDYLHEFVASNWDHGALYAILQSNTLEHIASSRGSATIGHLSQQSGIPEDKLSRILGLLRCRNIVQMPENGVFTLTAVAEELLFHEDFRAWVEFEYVPFLHEIAVQRAGIC